MQSEDVPRQDAFDSARHRSSSDYDAPLPALAYGKIRQSMLVVCALMGLAAIASFGYSGYLSYKFWATAGLLIETTVIWVTILGHLVRAVGLTFLTWRLSKVASCISAVNSEPSDVLAIRQRRFWRACAWVLAALAGCAVLEITYTWQRDAYGFFRPEFASGFVALKPDRIEFRRGSEAPVAGWARMKKRNADEELSVSPVVEVTGNDIRRAVVRIAEIFPGSQSVELSLQLTDEGAIKMERLTTTHLTRPLAVIVDGELRAMPRVFSPISGHFQLLGVFTLEEAAGMIREGLDR